MIPHSSLFTSFLAQLRRKEKHKGRKTKAYMKRSLSIPININDDSDDFCSSTYRIRLMWGYVYSPPLFFSNCVAGKNMQKEGYNCEIWSFRFSREVKLVYRGQLILWSNQWNSGYSSILLSFEVLYPSSSPIKTSHGLWTSFASASKLYGLEISEKRLRRTICSQRPRLAWKTHASKLPNRRLYNLHCTLLIV